MNFVIQMFFIYFPMILTVIFFIIFILIGIAFFTLLERKVLASMQRRKGPNVVGFLEYYSLSRMV